MNYSERENSLIELAELDPKTVHGSDLSECADALMDGCAEELTGIDAASLSPECRARVERVIAAIRGVGIPASLPASHAPVPIGPVIVPRGAM